MGTEELQLQTWVVSFAPADGSPQMAEELAALRTIVYRTRNLGSTFHMVTLPTDPARASQEDRKAALEKHCSSSRLWAFLGGGREKVERAERAVLGPLRLDAPPADQVFLVDGRGRIRGMYGIDKPSIDRLMQDVGYVSNIP